MKGKMPDTPAVMPAETSGFEIRWRPWLFAAILAFLFHVMVLFPDLSRFWPGFGNFAQTPTKPRVDIKSVDPKKLAAIRKQWKSRERALLLDKNLSIPTAKEPPPDARYMSDRNMRVEKEQRAKQTAVLPKSGAPGEPATPLAQSQPKTEPVTPPDKRTQHRLPSLGNLGIPLPAAPRRPSPRQQAAASQMEGNAMRGGEDGGAQAVRDPNLPEGSENLLNAQESVYYSFYSRLYEAIGPVWQSKIRSASRMRRLQPGDYTTQVDVVFDAQGTLLEVKILTPSSIEEFDKAAQSAWRFVGRFPNPPAGLLNEEGQVHTGWTFTVQLHQGMNLDSLPPERVY